ncbi:MAG TPA: DUF3108 domain-containing protein [Xanthobacteraceae bacterium]|nr:DUF3108 domain-containing protein [Xanthobacteraceae bacterium]
MNFRSKMWRCSLGSALVLAASAPALADGRLEARYKLSLGGLELGRASFVLEVGAATYTAAGSARVTGMMQAVSSGRGSAGSRGTVEPGRLSPQSFAMDAESDKKAEAIRLVIAADAVKEVTVEPPLNAAKDRVPVSDADKKGILDPLTAALVMMPGTGDMLAPAACDRVLSIFDGRQRYDLELHYVRTERVKAERGYAGPAVVCRIDYHPVSGHRPSRSGVKYMMQNKDIYIWLAPVAGTRVLAPFKASVATAVGNAELEATAFTSQPTGGVPAR